MRTFDHDFFADIGLDRNWVQENHSFSSQAGILRGLHFQFPPYSETKLIRVVKGAILDVYVDLRKDSPTFGRWGSLELTEENKKMLFISRGFAHGFYTLAKRNDVLYKVDNFYHADAEGGIIWDDSELKISWPVKAPLLSSRDAKLPSFREFREKYGGL